MTGGQALVQQLFRQGIDTIFGLPGVQLAAGVRVDGGARVHGRVITGRRA